MGEREGGWEREGGRKRGGEGVNGCKKLVMGGLEGGDSVCRRG